MSLIANQTLTLVSQYRQFVVEKNFEALIGLAAAGATYWFSGIEGSENTFAGTLPFAERVNNLAGALPPQFNLDFINSIVVQEKTAFFEVHAQGSGPNPGQTYENTVAVRLEQENGKITSIREYVDFFAILKFLNGGN